MVSCSLGNKILINIFKPLSLLFPTKASIPPSKTNHVPLIESNPSTLPSPQSTLTISTLARVTINATQIFAALASLSFLLRTNALNRQFKIAQIRLCDFQRPS